MSEDTRAALQAALGEHVDAQRDAVASGQDPAGVDRSAVNQAAADHLEASAPLADLQAAMEALREDPDADPYELMDAEHAFAARRQAERIAGGRPVSSGASAGTGG